MPPRICPSRTTEALRHGAMIDLRASASPWFVTVVIAALVLGSSVSVLATTVLPVDFAQMVSESQLIVHGRVVDVRGVMTGGRRTIESVVTMEVLDTLKGAPGRAVSFRVPNGQVGRYRRVMVGAPEFAAGDELVLFLK